MTTLSSVRHRSRSDLPGASPGLPAAARIVSSDDPTLGWAEKLALRIENRPITELRPYAQNPRTHSRKQLKKLAACFRDFGFLVPILINKDGEVVAGHARLAAASLLGMTMVPVVVLEHLRPEQLRGFRLADNRMAEESSRDAPKLAIELKALIELETFEIESTGFEMGEIDVWIGAAEASQHLNPDDETPEPREAAVSQLGDLWILGKHRLLCRDARERASYVILLGGELAQIVITDPPYNVRIRGHVSGLGKVRHREFVMASGEMARPEFIAWLKSILCHLAAVSVDGAIHYIFMDWRHLRELMEAGSEVYGELKQLIVWAKTNAGMGSFYRSQHELVLVYKHGTAPHINNFGLGSCGRHRTNVWSYAGANSMKRGRAEELAMHPTVKPVALLADAMLDCSRRGRIVLDAFGGSGSTLIAAERTGRRAYLLELDPLYVDVAIRRWEKLAGKPARHAITGLTFVEMAARRGAGEVGHG
jgi:DNA modification methylase